MLAHVILSQPSPLPTLMAPATEDAPTSWIQIARTGEFTSSRYGKFAITTADLRSMHANFTTGKFPEPPTRVPIDYDHLSMAPKQPGDGIAAGWIKNLELRQGNTELWGEVAWTADAARRIAAREYQFVSPSFVKDHTSNTGEKLGTTLLAAAITNHPFLQGLQALTLYSCSAMGDLALPVTRAARAPQLRDCADVGQTVTFLDDPEAVPELSNEERGQTLVVKSAVGEGDDQFVRLTTLGGAEFGWFRSTQLSPASAAGDGPEFAPESPLPDAEPEVTSMSTSQQMALAERFQQTVARHRRAGATASAALHLSSVEDPTGALAWREIGLLGEAVADAPVEPSTPPGAPDPTGFEGQVARLMAQGLDARAAVRAVGLADPGAAHAYRLNGL
jgi:hypothetical protein